MRFRSALIHSVAAATIFIVAPVVMPPPTIHSTAQAATKVAVSIGTFYDDLAPYGDWVNYDGAYVFVPANLPGGWRPYTVGHWANTERYGWLWVSDEPFGWATYHYGRWGYAEDIGWYWVPGRRWAPAWVSWRRSADHVVWAPLPPGRGNDVTVEIAVEDIPDEYWVAVPSRHFLDADVSVVVVNDDHERVRLVEAAEPAGNVTIENNIVVNNVIDIDYVEKATRQKVKTVAVKETDDPKQAGKGGEGEVAIFSSEVKEEGEAKPKKVEDVETIKEKQAQKKEEAPEGQQPEGTKQPSQQKGTSEQPAQPGQVQTEQGEQQPGKEKGKATGQPAQPEEAQPEQGQEQPAKKKGKATEQPAQPEETQPEQGQEQPVKKKKGEATEQPAQPEEALPEQGEAQPVKKKRPAQSKEMQPEQPQGGEEPVQGKKSKQPPAGSCDQASGEGCAQ
jgi:hypothetical protein